jgi:NitT/TauT family transport system substrate-binding protein
MTSWEGSPCTRRLFLRLVAVGGGAALLQACAPSQPSPTVAPSKPAEAQPAAPATSPTGAPGAAPVTKPAGPMTQIRISAFNPPSAGAFLPPIIKERQFDKENGLDLEFVYKPSNTYNVDFAAGQDLVGGSSALISEARRVNEGVPVRYLFNVFTFYGAVLTEQPDIQALKDLEGKSLAADTVTTAWAMMQFFMGKAGVDLSKTQIQSQQTAGMVALLQAKRIDAVATTEPTVSVMLNQGPNFRAIPVFDPTVWRTMAGDEPVGYLGVSAHTRWIEANRDAVPRLMAAYAAAVKFGNESSGDAAKIISEANRLEPKAIEDAIKAGRMGFEVAPASKLKRSVEAVLEAAMEAKQIDKRPRVEELIYDGL